MPKFLHRVLFISSWICLAGVFSGVNYCQKSYSIGAQSSLTDTPSSTETTTPTPTDEGDDGVVTRTATPTETSEPTATTTPTEEATASAAQLLRSLSELSEPDQKPVESTKKPRENWLGKIGKKGDRSANATDSDHDGYLDWFEESRGTDLMDSSSFPEVQPSTRISASRGNDDDLDGLPNRAEIEQGTDPMNRDSDGDGVWDGAEVLSGEDPRNSVPSMIDEDGDGLNGSFERTLGFDPNLPDADYDGLRDDQELALGTNSKTIDSDGDGLSDLKETEIGSDPTMPDHFK